jgi:hypothetical protein
MTFLSYTASHQETQHPANQMAAITITFSLAQIQDLVKVAQEAIARGDTARGISYTIAECVSAQSASTSAPVAAAAASTGGAEPLNQTQLAQLLAKGFYSKSQTRAMADHFTKWGLPESAHKAARDQWVAFAKANGRTENPKNDPEREKRAPNPYMRFANANRDKVKAEKPEMNPVEIIKELGARWKAMTVDEKAPYVAEFEAEKSSRSASPVASAE